MALKSLSFLVEKNWGTWKGGPFFLKYFRTERRNVFQKVPVPITLGLARCVGGTGGQTVSFRLGRENSLSGPLYFGQLKFQAQTESLFILVTNSVLQCPKKRNGCCLFIYIYYDIFCDVILYCMILCQIILCYITLYGIIIHYI